MDTVPHTWIGVAVRLIRAILHGKPVDPQPCSLFQFLAGWARACDQQSITSCREVEIYLGAHFLRVRLSRRRRTEAVVNGTPPGQAARRLRPASLATPNESTMNPWGKIRLGGRTWGIKA